MNNQIPSMRPTRRQFIGGAAGAAIAAPMLTRSAMGQDVQRLVFAVPVDNSGANRELVEAFNQSNGSGIEVVIFEMPARSDEHRTLIESELNVGREEIDVFAADVVWTSQLAVNGWVRNLTSRFYAEADPGEFLQAPMNSILFRNQMWGVPWFTDAGMVFYRRDLLEQAGVAVPTTWAELQEAANTVRQATGTAHGFLFQGASYEGGTANACEFIWSGGGRIMTQQRQVFDAYSTDSSHPNDISLNSAATVAGLNAARSLVESGASPLEVTAMDETMSNDAFLAGDAVFLRSWPSLYALAGTGSAVSRDQIGIMPIPAVEAGQQSTSCLGGWNLMISAFSSKVDAAWQFISYATSAEAQSARARTGAFLPTRGALYEDASLAADVPLVELGRTAVETSRTRPASVIYPQVSPRISLTFNRILKGEWSADEGVQLLSDDLNVLMRRSRG